MHKTIKDTSSGEGNMKLPNNFNSWNPAMRGAYMKGRKAFEAGHEITDCPYKDKRKDCGRLTWSRAFITAWGDGWNDAKLDAAITEYYHDRATGCHANRAT